MKINLDQLAKITHGQATHADIEFNGSNFDTRSLMPGQLFIALTEVQDGNQWLKTARDGHEFLQAAKEAGAAAALVTKKIDIDLPQVVVNNTYTAWCQLAAFCRQQLSGKTFAITGSCGKTTTRALLTSICQHAGKTAASTGSYNNFLGVPYTLSLLDGDEDFYVQEIGANHMGEIDPLSRLVKPDIACVLCVAPVHVEGFGSLDNIAKGKSEIFNGLNERGVAVLNLDEPYALGWAEALSHKAITSFAVDKPADVVATDIYSDSDGLLNLTLTIGSNQAEITTPLVGEHHVNNVLAAAACAHAAGVGFKAICQGLKTAVMEAKRMQVTLRHGIRIINDSYNSNPKAARAAINTLCQFGGHGVAVLGDMGELGENALAEHVALLEYALEKGVQNVMVYGSLMQQATKQIQAEQVQWFDNKTIIARQLQDLPEQTTVLVKASKSVRLWEVLEPTQ